jgi:broad specificity phosphatase PhoE
MRRLIATLLAAAALAPALAAQPSTVILVRHAEKASQTEADPVLSDAGVQRARDLAVALADAHVGAIITTQFQRTKLTGAPLAAATSLTSIVVPTAPTADAHIANVAAAVRGRPAGEVVLVVGHSNTIGAIIGALGGPKLPNLCDSQYSTMFILEMNGSNPPRLIRAHYGAADPADASCATMKSP